MVTNCKNHAPFSIKNCENDVTKRFSLIKKGGTCWDANEIITVAAISSVGVDEIRFSVHVTNWVNAVALSLMDIDDIVMVATNRWCKQGYEVRMLECIHESDTEIQYHCSDGSGQARGENTFQGGCSCMEWRNFEADLQEVDTCVWGDFGEWEGKWCGENGFRGAWIDGVGSKLANCCEAASHRCCWVKSPGVCRWVMLAMTPISNTAYHTFKVPGTLESGYLNYNWKLLVYLIMLLGISAYVCACVKERETEWERRLQKRAHKLWFFDSGGHSCWNRPPQTEEIICVSLWPQLNIVTWNLAERVSSSFLHVISSQWLTWCVGLCVGERRVFF